MTPGFCPINISKQWHEHSRAIISLHQMEPMVCLLDVIIIIYQSNPTVHSHTLLHYMPASLEFLYVSFFLKKLGR